MATQQPNPVPGLAHFAVCDDVRAEQSGKVTLVGLYGRSIRTGRIPAALPKLCFLAEFELLTQPMVLSLRVISPSGMVMLEAKNIKMVHADQHVSIPKEYRYSQLIFQIAPMPLQEEGVYRVDFAFVDGPTIHADFFVSCDPSLLRQKE